MSLYKLISSKDPKDLEEQLAKYDVAILGSTFIRNEVIYQSFIGLPKKTPTKKATPKKPTEKPKEDKPAPKKRASRKPKAE